MPIGNQNRNGNSNKKMVFVNAITKDENDQDIKPFFSFKEKTGEDANGKKIYTEIAKDTSFSGNLTKVEAYEKEIKSKGIKQPRVKILFEDEDTIYYMDMSYTILSRSFFNSLLSLNSLEDLSLQIYHTKPNEKGKVYPQMSLRQGAGKDNMVRWLYAKDDLPPIKKVKVKGQEMSDTEDVDNFFRDKLNAKFADISTIGAGSDTDAEPAVPAPKTTPKTKVKSKTQEGVDDQDVPF